MAKISGKKILGWLLGTLLFGGLLYLVLVPRPVAVEVVAVKRGEFKEKILADGILRSKDKYTVPAFADGDIKRMPLQVGDPVKKGEIITELYWDVKFEPVRAPIEGVVSKVYRDSAGPIRRGDPIVELIDPKRLEVMAELLTTDAVRLKEGGPMEVLHWPGADEVRGAITRISKAGFVKPSALGVEEERTEVTADLKSLPSNLAARAGSTFHVDIAFDVAEIKDALKVPVGALFRDGSAWAVYVDSSSRATLKHVELAGKNAEEAAIAAGLAEGERVLVFPGDLVKDGTRIKPAL